MLDLKNRVAIITGASRGIGKKIALRLAQEGVKIVVAAKTTHPNPRLPGTIDETVEEIRALGAEAIAVKTNVRHSSDLKALVNKTLEAFGKIDILLNNAGALWVEPIENTKENRFDLVMDVNFKAPFLLSKLCIPHMLKNGWGHIVNMSPPMGTEQLTDFGGKIAYLSSKVNMTFLTHGLGKEYGGTGVACNSLWPRTLVESLATINWGMGEPKDWRKADLIVDSTLNILLQNPKTFTGNALFAEDFLQEYAGVEDLDVYNMVPGGTPIPMDWNTFENMIKKAKEGMAGTIRT